MKNGIRGGPERKRLPSPETETRKAAAAREGEDGGRRFVAIHRPEPGPSPESATPRRSQAPPLLDTTKPSQDTLVPPLPSPALPT